MKYSQRLDLQSVIFLKFGMWQHAMVAAIAAAVVRANENPKP